ncbi:hypothetical protein R3P38DRAFT_1650882 [Favolaschia claudopus]|uniref:Uncharacterized protein n=1 Tax=Favolaschia claudopus TaxID=2862362 RepID=A0AAW0DNI4_9AGAR
MRATEYTTAASIAHSRAQRFLKRLSPLSLLIPHSKRSQTSPSSGSRGKELHPSRSYSEGTVVPARETITEPKKSRPIIDAETRRTATNALYVSLKMLSNISSRTPLSAPLSAIIDPLLDLTDRFEQTSINAQNLTQLSDRIDRLTPVVARLAANNPEEGQVFIESLERVLGSIFMDLQAAEAAGKLARFFNADDNTATIEKHNTALTQLLTDSMFAAVHEVNRRVHEMGFESPSEWEVTGGLGGMGGPSEKLGGKGGRGEGPQLNFVPDYRLPGNMKLSGGTGGQGGASLEAGGRGGTGKGPVLNWRPPRKAFTYPSDHGSPKKEYMP